MDGMADSSLEVFQDSSGYCVYVAIICMENPSLPLRERSGARIRLCDSSRRRDEGDASACASSYEDGKIVLMHAD